MPSECSSCKLLGRQRKVQIANHTPWQRGNQKTKCCTTAKKLQGFWSFKFKLMATTKFTSCMQEYKTRKYPPKMLLLLSVLLWVPFYSGALWKQSASLSRLRLQLDSSLMKQSGELHLLQSSHRWALWSKDGLALNLQNMLTSGPQQQVHRSTLTAACCCSTLLLIST